MKLNYLKPVLLGFAFIVVSFVSNANASLITVDNWHLTTDELGGLRQSSASDKVYYAVSKIWQLDKENTFEEISGYHFATYQEWRDLVGVGYNANKGYKNQGGWNDYEWEGKERYFFTFLDSIESGWYKHAGNSDTTANTTGFYQGRTGMAGFVMIKNDLVSAGILSVPVPETSTLAIFLLGMIGFAARPFNK